MHNQISIEVLKSEASAIIGRNIKHFARHSENPDVAILAIFVSTDFILRLVTTVSTKVNSILFISNVVSYISSQQPTHF
jgi:hypothetical protein